LTAQLEENTQRFLSDRRRNRRVDNRLELSSLFRWYRGDFDRPWRGTSGLAGFLARYATALGLDAVSRQRLLSGAMDIVFLDYDWRLNGKL